MPSSVLATLRFLNYKMHIFFANHAFPTLPKFVPPAADAARGADGFTRREREALRIVNAEYERSQQGGWRRLFPSSRSKEYSGYLDPARQLHHLPFNV